MVQITLKSNRAGLSTSLVYVDKLAKVFVVSGLPFRFNEYLNFIQHIRQVNNFSFRDFSRNLIKM